MRCPRSRIRLSSNTNTSGGEEVADYRMIGVVDMAAAIRLGGPPGGGRIGAACSGVMEAFDRSSREERHIAITTTCARPEPVPLGTVKRSSWMMRATLDNAENPTKIAKRRRPAQ